MRWLDEDMHKEVFFSEKKKKNSKSVTNWMLAYLLVRQNIFLLFNLGKFRKEQVALVLVNDLFQQQIN